MKNLRVLIACVLLSLAACNGDSGSAASSSSSSLHKPKTAAIKVGPSREEQTAGMVQAASPSRSTAVGELKFDILSRPIAGVPLNIELALLPAMDAPSVSLDISGSDGLNVVKGDEAQSLTDVSRVNVYRKSVTVTPANEGMYFLTVLATFKNADFADARSFSIPIIAGSATAVATPTPIAKH